MHAENPEARDGSDGRRGASLLATLLIQPIRFYRRWISPLKPPTCRFVPTCSSYGIEAMRVHGGLRGTLLTVGRLLRCQPFCEGGYDPVPGSDLARRLPPDRRQGR